jgi:hypothetical protein
MFPPMPPDEEDPAEQRAFSEFKLDGDRFRGGRLPVDALVELERYRALLLAAAERAWLIDHPDSDLPEDFEREFDLAIKKVDDGSAVSVLERPESVYGDYFDLGRDTVDAMFAEIVQGIDPKALEGAPPRDKAEPLAPDLVEAFLDLGTHAAFRDLGSSLEVDEKAVFPERDSDIQVTMGVRTKVVRPLVKKVREITVSREHLDSIIAGRLIALNAERRNYTVNTLLYGTINGRYADEAKTAELRAVLDSSSLAPVVRIEGRMSWVRGRLEKILDVDNVELFEIESEPWSRRFIELASLGRNWSDEADTSDVISFSALDAAREIIRAIARNERSPFPGITPMEDGGVHIQWLAIPRHTSVEISPEAEFYGHTLLVENFDSDREILRPSNLETRSLQEIIAFLEGAIS